MAGPVILSGSTLAAGIRDDFDRTYQQTYDGVEASLGEVMQLNVPSDKRTEIYGMHRTMPYPERWDSGNEAIPEEGTDSLSFSITNYDYAKRIKWRRNDRQDNQVGDLRGKAEQTGRNFASLDSRVFIELLTAAATLLPAIPNAPDGAALYSATDGASADRFGISGGNIITGTGVATSGAVEADFFNAIERFGQFLNTKGQPYFEPDVASERYTIYFGIANTGVFIQAFRANLVHSVATSTGAGVTNVIMASGAQVTLRPTSRITDNDWFVFRGDSPVRALFSQMREPLRAAEATEDNSDTARDTGVEYVQWVERKGFGVNVPFATVQVNN